MSAGSRLVPVGRVGRPHGLDGGFHVVAGDRERLAPGWRVTVGGRELTVERLGGTAERPVLRLEGMADRDAARELAGEVLYVSERDAPLVEGEWLAADLVGCAVEPFGTVRRVVSGPSCDVLEVGPEGVLVPFVSDAIRRIDPRARRIEIDLEFLGMADEAPESAEPAVDSPSHRGGRDPAP